MLAGTRLSDNTLFTHALSQQHLAEDVINLVGPGVV